MFFADLLDFLQVMNQYFLYNTRVMLVCDKQRTAMELMLSHRESQTGGIESMAFQHHTGRKSVINQVPLEYSICCLYLEFLPTTAVAGMSTAAQRFELQLRTSCA